jgi:predicted outer membrane protein
MKRKSLGAAALLALTAMLPALAFSEDDGQAAMKAYMDADHRMMTDMGMAMSGDADKDFVAMMIPHHQGAIDMARVALRHSNDPFTRQLAETVIIEQQREIAEMQAWLAQRGAMVPPGGKPGYVGDSQTFLKPSPEPGTRAELAGQSWAPGTGIPASRPASK